MRIGLDAMGGDHAPASEVQGALAARKLLGEDDTVVLIGRQEAILAEMAKAGAPAPVPGIDVRHAEQAIGMDEPPVEALRTKQDSSIAVMAQMQADGELDAGISAGNTGACVAAAQMRLRRLSGVHRPGIAIVLPTPHGPVAVCDVGANVNCRPQHLLQYGIMASVYLQAIYGVKDPRVGLLSIGEEEVKGNNLVKRTRELLDGEPGLPFVGNVEGRDLFSGTCDVVVCEGFVGNVVLKLMEGMAEAVVRTLLGDLLTALPTEAMKIKQAARSMASKFDFNEYGGAPLLGVGGISIICHGASDPRGIMNAIRVALSSSKYGVNEKITEWLARDQDNVQ